MPGFHSFEPELLLDGVDNSDHLSLVAGGGDDETVGQTGTLGQFEEHDVLGLLREGGPCCGTTVLDGVHLYRPFSSM